MAKLCGLENQKGEQAALTIWGGPKTQEGLPSLVVVKTQDVMLGPMVGKTPRLSRKF